MQKPLYIILLIIFFSCATYAQSDSTKLNEISFSAGANQGYLKDLNFSPLNHRVNSMAYELGYLKETKKSNSIFVRINFSSGTLKTKAASQFDADRYLVNFKLGYLRGYNTSNNRIKLQIGLQYHTYLSMIFYDGTDAFTYFGLHGLDIIGKLSYQLENKHIIGTSLEVPTFGVLVRPPFSGINKFQQENSDLKIATDGKFTSFNNFFAFQWQLNYKYQLSEQLGLVLTNNFSFYNTKYVQSSTIADNQILIGVDYKF